MTTCDRDKTNTKISILDYVALKNLHSLLQSTVDLQLFIVSYITDYGVPKNLNTNSISSVYQAFPMLAIWLPPG